MASIVPSGLAGVLPPAAEPFAGRDVLVVGAGNTGAEIAVDLVEGGAGRVRMAIRTPPHVVLRESNGMPTQATGVIMAQLGIGADEALVRLRAHAFTRGRTALDEARDVVSHRVRFDQDPF